LLLVRVIRSARDHKVLLIETHSSYRSSSSCSVSLFFSLTLSFSGVLSALRPVYCLCVFICVWSGGEVSVLFYSVSVSVLALSLFGIKRSHRTVVCSVCVLSDPIRSVTLRSDSIRQCVSQSVRQLVTLFRRVSRLAAAKIKINAAKVIFVNFWLWSCRTVWSA